MKKFWNSRYSNEDYAYGKEPNSFFKHVLDKFELKGKIILPAEGEGRNAVYAAKKGLSVYAFDISEQGMKKANRLAKSEKVKIHYEVNNFLDDRLLDQLYDCAALIYAHFPAHSSAEYHKRLGELIKPNGILILEGFSKNHLELQKDNPNIGGPKNIEMLFSLDQIKRDFSSFEIIKLEETEVDLQEGKFHNGKGIVIRFIGRKEN